MESFEGIEIRLENKQYRIELENSFNYGVRMNLRRDIGSKTKDHGTIALRKKDVDNLIDALIYMRDNIDWLE